MARPKHLRRLTCSPPSHVFIPASGESTAGSAESMILTMDEFEALRLADLECHSQEEAAKDMRISRATFGRIIESGRAKVARALVFGLRIEISGGAFIFGDGRTLQCPRCRRKQSRQRLSGDHIECRGCCQLLQHRERPLPEKSE